jgi:hypothetical protein
MREGLAALFLLTCLHAGLYCKWASALAFHPPSKDFSATY